MNNENLHDTDDLISRKMAIDAVVAILGDETARHNGWIDPYYAVQKIKGLPSAGMNSQLTCNQLATNCNQLATDLISRKAVLEKAYELDLIDTGNDIQIMVVDLKDIESLPSVVIQHNPNDSNVLNVLDCVSRQAAIEAVDAYLGLSEVSKTIQNMTSLQDILKNLPSVEPEIIRCKECKHWGLRQRDFCDIWNDYISNGHFYCGCAKRREDD